MKRIILLILIFQFFSVHILYGVEDKVVAIINNEAITKAELDSYINLIKLQVGYEGWRQYGMSERKALENLIEDRLVVQEAKRKELEIADRLIESRLEETKSKFGSEFEFSEFLAKQGLSLTELKQRIKEKMLSDKLINIEVRSRIFVSPKEVTEFYQEHINDFYLPERVRLESIFVQDKDLSKQIYERLKEGADFAEFQNKFSEKSSLDLVNRGQLLKEIEDVVFSLDVGEFSKPLEISGGYYIFLAQEKFPPSKKKLIEVQDGIRNILLETRFNTRLKKLIEKLKENSYIVIK